MRKNYLKLQEYLKNTSVYFSSITERDAMKVGWGCHIERQMEIARQH